MPFNLNILYTTHLYWGSKFSFFAAIECYLLGFKALIASLPLQEGKQGINCAKGAQCYLFTKSALTFLGGADLITRYSYHISLS